MSDVSIRLLSHFAPLFLSPLYSGDQASSRHFALLNDTYGTSLSGSGELCSASSTHPTPAHAYARFSASSIAQCSLLVPGDATLAPQPCLSVHNLILDNETFGGSQSACCLVANLHLVPLSRHVLGLNLLQLAFNRHDIVQVRHTLKLAFHHATRPFQP